jgi:rare lipoprotein A
MTIKHLKTFALTAVLLLLLQSCGTTHTRYTKSRHTAKHTVKASANSSVKASTFKSNVAASYYHDKFNGRKTASGAVFNNNNLTTAHPSLPFGTQLRVTNRANGKQIVVTVTDRGPFAKGRELDLSKRAFMSITDDKNKGILQVDIEILAK